MKDFKYELEEKIRDDFYRFLEGYGHRSALEFLGQLKFQVEIYVREKEAQWRLHHKS